MTLDSTELLNVIDPHPSHRVAEEDARVNSLRYDDALDVPYALTDMDLWENYTNDDLYYMDKKIREWLKKIEWRKVKKNYKGKKIFRTTASAVFTWIYGRPPGPGADGPACSMIHRLLVYYCTSYTGKTTLNGKPVGRVYKFTPTQSRLYGNKCKRPYSLRLRLEEANERAKKTGVPVKYENVFRASAEIDKIDAHRRANYTPGKDEHEGRSRNQRRFAANDWVSPGQRDKRSEVSSE